MADDAAGKDAKKAEEAVVTENVESTADKAADTAADSGSEVADSSEVADFDAEASPKDSDDSKDDSKNDSEDDEDISLEPDDEEDGKSGGMKGRHWALTAAAVAVIAVAAGTAVIGRLYEEQRIEQSSSSEALVAAQEFANVMINVDSTKLDDTSSKTLDKSTGDFKKNYAESSAALRQVMVENKAKATGAVVDSAVKSATPDKVEVLLFIDQAVTNVAVQEPRMDRSRVQITMEKVDGRWLASNVELA
ncbi:hypothetical protein FZI91_07730 [Mycobacterium sp. CBMA271]|uniref:hypothetical protein n=1 Tax=unclassified Mycobacteroides TaxID=2618759 RepID=UPI0012DD7608|nr:MULTISPECIES: hypothetical protein [unclassified Mycobacteroides]MUM19182.1 hypothetical protein [Mycobacteroides sp. CBMA 326]MUM21596.1 hypothetical protein [Mycobacteroides sp. CBMA 271]